MKLSGVGIWSSQLRYGDKAEAAEAAAELESVSDRLFDAIIAWGDEDTIFRRIRAHELAGADHVCIQALEADPRIFPREQWQRIAAALR